MSRKNSLTQSQTLGSIAAFSEASAQSLNQNRGLSHRVKILTSIPKIAMVNVDGSNVESQQQNNLDATMHGNLTVTKLTKKVMSALNDAKVKVILVTQACAMHSLAIAIDESEGQRAANAIKRVFNNETSQSTDVNEMSNAIVACSLGYSTISIVGDQMRGAIGSLARFTSALSANHVNIVAIAQGSSERSISVVVSQKNLDLGLRSVHTAFEMPLKGAKVTGGCAFW